MKSTVSPRAAAILDFLALSEGKGNYLAYFGHSDSKDALPTTLAAVLAFQADLVKVRKLASSATGRYQFMPNTLKSLAAEYKIPLTSPFTPDFQDVLACALLERRGYSKWTSNALSTEGFADALSQEWASMPYHTGKSFYDGDGLNHSLVTRAAFLAMLNAAATLPNTPTIAATVAPVITSPIAPVPPVSAAPPAAVKPPAAPVAAAPAPPVATTKAPTMTSTAVTSAIRAAVPGVDFLAGIENFGEHILSSLTAGAKAIVNPAIPSVTGEAGSSTFFGTLENVKAAAGKVAEIVADFRNKDAREGVADGVDLAKLILATLDIYKIDVPVLSTVVASLPDLHAAKAA